MVNKWLGIGNLVADPEVRYTQDGTAIANFKVACDSGHGEHKHTEFMRCVTFGRLAEVCGEYLLKGSKVYVCGSIQTRKWMDREDKPRYTTEAKIAEMKMLSSRASRESDEVNAQGEHHGEPPMDEDVPF